MLSPTLKDGCCSPEQTRESARRFADFSCKWIDGPLEFMVPDFAFPYHRLTSSLGI